VIMKSFSDWLYENNEEQPLGGAPMIKNSNMGQADDTKIDSMTAVGRRAAEKYGDKFLDSMWRISKDTDDDELQEMLGKIDSNHKMAKKTGFGMEDDMDGLDHGNKDVVPNSADNGMGDSGDE
jgi:hypothetical protein